MRKTKSKPDARVAGLLSALPLPSRAPTPEEVDMLIAMWGTDLKQDPTEKHRLEISIVELTSALGTKFGESELIIGFVAKKTAEMIAAAISMDAVNCMLEVTSTLMIGIAAGIRLGLMMERNDRMVSEGLAMTAGASEQEDRL